MAGALGSEPRMAVSKPLPYRLAMPNFKRSDISYITKIKQFLQLMTKI